MLHVVESAKPLDQVVEALPLAVVRHKFGVLGVPPHQVKRVVEANRRSRPACPTGFRSTERAPGQAGDDQANSSD